VRIDRRGHTRRFARLPGGWFLSGIAFDTTGAFGHRLLVTATQGVSGRLPATAHLADRGTPGNPHPGTDSVLALTLTTSLVRRGELLVATEGGAETIAIHCASRCTARHVADGPAVTHAEGHIAF
jgi:hypothetical protein